MTTSKIELLLTSIQQQRKLKGLTLENMANDLGISHSAYRKTENGQSKLTVERLLQIAEILDVSVSELLDEVHARIYNQSNLGTDILIGHQEFNNFHGTKEQEIHDFSTLYQEVKILKAEIVSLKKGD